jgi:hypothetical protein
MPAKKQPQGDNTKKISQARRVKLIADQAVRIAECGESDEGRRRFASGCRASTTGDAPACGQEPDGQPQEAVCRLRGNPDSHATEGH